MSAGPDGVMKPVGVAEVLAKPGIQPPQLTVLTQVECLRGELKKKQRVRLWRRTGESVQAD
jgi:hypothetical protein